MRKLLLVAVSVAYAYGDYCYSNQNISIRVAQQGDKLNISASAPSTWVGIGVPRDENFTEMARGNFVLGGADQVYEYSLEMDYNWKPNMPLESVVKGTGNVNTVGQRTNLSFCRNLTGVGLHSVDPQRPFNLLWAFGLMKPDQTGYAALDYHHNNRGYIRVDLVNGNCAPLSSASVSAPSGKAGKKAGKRKAKMGQPVVCPEGRVACTAQLQKTGQNCVIGACVASASSCVGVTCVANMKCVGGKCVPFDSSCALIRCASGKKCMAGKCVVDDSGLHTHRGKKCSTEQKMCPDGSAVGRVPPNCTFKSCPGEGAAD